MMKLEYLASGVLFAATMLFNLAAYAQPVNLTCKSESGSLEGRVTFDESAQTAGFIAIDADNVPASSATFTNTVIRWAYQYPANSGKTYFSLSRTTGTLEETGNLRWHCTVDEKKF